MKYYYCSVCGSRMIGSDISYHVGTSSVLSALSCVLSIATRGIWPSAGMGVMRDVHTFKYCKACGSKSIGFYDDAPEPVPTPTPVNHGGCAKGCGCLFLVLILISLFMVWMISSYNEQYSPEAMDAKRHRAAAGVGSNSSIDTEGELYRLRHAGVVRVHLPDGDEQTGGQD